ncbi:MAG: sigma factor-like helix-turn-helix DNA-binding protein [Candidatus Pacebacteria bacterium]|nr:sigma factor-like helix-turn-helix DNA-binding protein [Candidatus Paceibacterota bacterium]
MDKLLAKLAERLQVFGADIISADETADWPTGKLDELVGEGVLVEIQHSKGVVCNECEENCFIEPYVRTNPDTGKTTGVFVCTRNPDIGRIEVDLNRLRQWEISGEKLEALGYTKKKTKKRNRKVSSDLTPKETEVFTLIHVQKKTPQQAAIEMQCSPQNVSNLLTKAEAKIKARRSHSINWDKTRKLPEDNRGQVQLSEDPLEEEQ